jgi:signal transduction histidine kinase
MSSARPAVSGDNQVIEWKEGILSWFGAAFDGTRQRQLALAAWVLAGGITLLDFLLGYEVTLRFVYCIPISLMVAVQGRRAALLLALACDAGWLAGDIAAGVRYSSAIVAIWNFLITLANYAFVIWLLGRLFALQRGLEERVQVRTAALVSEIAERERLERELMTIAEKERRSVGNDLHDGLCQHFTATAIAAQVLARRLEKEHHAAAADARGLMKLVEDGIGQTRQLAKGLLLVTVEIDGLATALAEMAASSTAQFRVPCEFRVAGAPTVRDVMVSTHLYRIAEEAVRNAVRHGKAGRVRLDLSGGEQSVRLVVDDDGVGLPGPELRGRGMGLRIMAHRAQIIGAKFTVGAAPHGGTRIECAWPGETACP